MRGFQAKSRLKMGLVLTVALTGLAACSDIDNMFGDDNSDMSASDAAAPSAGSLNNAPGGVGAAPIAAPVAGGAPVATITPINIENGADTGTQVNRTIQTLRAQMSGLEQKLA